MPNELEPVIGQWYWHHDKGQSFMVVAIEEEMIEIQHYDGDVEALDLDAWKEMDIDIGEPPEDWTGPVDDLETDDLDYSDPAMQRPSWGERGKDYRPRRESWSGEPESGEKSIDEQADNDAGETPEP